MLKNDTKDKHSTFERQFNLFPSMPTESGNLKIENYRSYKKYVEVGLRFPIGLYYCL